MYTDAAGPQSGHTIVHVTHEAVDHIGGIGTVLSGLLTAPSYRAAVSRSILVGPLHHADRPVASPAERLGEHRVKLLYSGVDEVDPGGYGALLRPVEWAFRTRIVYGTRRLEAPGHEPAEAELLLLDLSNPDRDRLGAFKWMLHQHFHIDSMTYEHSWDYEEYCRLADPAYHALCALLGASAQRGPAVLVAHEFMGMATALRAALDRRRFRTVFHAHECSTARRLVESLPGHDLAFYPAMRAAASQGMFVQDVFGPQGDYPRHGLVSKAHLLDNILAVGPETAEELRFLSPEMARARVRVAYNGLPAPALDPAAQRRSRALVDRWLTRVVGFAPDYLVTHVTRPVPSKGLWRDVKVMSHLRGWLASRGKSAVYLLLTCGAPIRSRADADAMASGYGWPAEHREGYPDLAGPEAAIWRTMAPLNHPGAEAGPGSGHVRAVLVNQFGFSPARLGAAAPEGLSTADLRSAADVELGMSVYEPYGIAQLEPLYAGAICVPSTVCGCLGLVQRAMVELGVDHARCPIVLPADFAGVGGGHGEVGDPARRGLELAPPAALARAHLSPAERDHIEERVAQAVAGELARRLHADPRQRDHLLELGQPLAQRMSWDRVATTDFLPGIREALARP